MTKPVTLAAIIGAHGVAGEVRLKLFGEGASSLSAHKSFNDGALTLVKVRDDGKGGAIARLAESTSRGDAEKLRGTALSVPRAALPPLAEGEFYHADLIGLTVQDSSGAEVGTVRAIHNHGAGDLLEILGPGMKSALLLPFTLAVVPTVDLKAGKVIVDLPEGLD